MPFLPESIVHALRFCRRDPSVAAPAVAILALGLGANLAIFGVAYTVLLRPLPVADQQSLMIMWERAEQRGVSVWEVSYPNFIDWGSRNRSFTDLAATGSINWSLRLVQRDGPVILPFAAVSGTFFDVLGARAALGRALTRADDARGSPGVAVVSDETWRSQFQADPGVVGRTAMMDDGAGPSAVTIVGVMAPEFDYPRGAALWLPIAPTLARLSVAEGYDMLAARDLGILYVLGRLRPGVTLARAQADMDTLVEGLTGTGKPGTGRSSVVTPLADHIFGQTRPALLLLMAAAAVVLLLACANVIGLLLARQSAKRRELVIQIALGADRWRLIRQSVAEGAAVVVAGMAAAVLLAFWCVPILTAVAPETVPRLNEVTLRRPMLTAFGLGIGVLAALACGIFPAVVVGRTPVGLLRREEATIRPTSPMVRNGLLVAQTALAVVLLVAAMLTVRSFHAIQRVQLGFDPADLVTVDLLAPAGTYDKRETNTRFYREAIDRVRQLPGVSAVAGIYLRPFEFGPIGSGVAVVLEGHSPRDREAWSMNPTLNAEAITPDYFKVMKIPIVEGRPFTDRDAEGAPPVVIVSLSAARRLWPGQDPIGKRLIASYDRPDGDWQTVVGVAGDARYRGLTEPTFDLYKPYLQSEDAVKHLIVQGSVDPSTFLGRLRSEIRSVHPAAVVDEIRPMRAVVDRQMAPWRFAALLFSLLAVLGVVVAVIGLYALLSRQVVERTREIGIRIALGAHRQQIVRFFAMLTGRVVATGLLVGLIGAFIVSRSMNALLFGVEPTDALTYTLVCVLLILAATAGAYWPIRRATTVDPIVALRRD